MVGHSPLGCSGTSSRHRGSINYSKMSWSSKAAPDLHSTTMYDCWYDGLFMKYCVTPHVIGLKPYKKFVSSVHRILSQKSCFLANVRRLFMCSDFLFGTFLQSLSDCWIMQFFRRCSGFFCDLMDESLLCSWEGSPSFPEIPKPWSSFVSLSRLTDINDFVFQLFL